MKITSQMNSMVRKRIRTIGYSSAGRLAARQILKLDEKGILRTKIKAYGVEHKINNMATDALPEGKFYAKLVIRNWQQFEGHQFLLMHEGEKVFGGIIEAPRTGSPLEYRNIVVPSNDSNEFSLSLDVPYTLSIGPGAFFTKQQRDYDQKKNIKKHGNLYYSQRGNMRNPRHIVFTFPAFQKFENVVTFAVDDLSFISQDRLDETLIISFQDRYHTFGSFLLSSDISLNLKRDVEIEIRNLVRKHSVHESNILFYGSAEGASSAIIFAEPYHKSKLIVEGPKMDLNYYLRQPKFRFNLGAKKSIQDAPKPYELFKNYLSQNRQIDYFYFNGDDRANYSLVEQLPAVPNLRVYRLGMQSTSARPVNLDSKKYLINRFLGNSPELPINVNQVRLFQNTLGYQVQIRLASTMAETHETDWYIASSDGATSNAILLEAGSYPFMKYTTEDQTILDGIDEIRDLKFVIGLSGNGTRFCGELPAQTAEIIETTDLESIESSSMITEMLDLNLVEFKKCKSKKISVYSGKKFASFSVSMIPALGDNQVLDFILVDNIEDLGFEFDSTLPNHGQIVVDISENVELLEVLLGRMFVSSGATEFNFVVPKDALSDDALELLENELRLLL